MTIKFRHSLQQWLDNDAIAAWIFLAPALILLGVFLLWPIVYLFYLSFTTGSFTAEGVRWAGLGTTWVAGTFTY